MSVELNRRVGALERLVNRLLSASGAGGTDHGGLAGLADDDHTQYILATGTRAFTGPAKFADGSDVAPSIVQASDTDTGFFFGSLYASLAISGAEKIRYRLIGGDAVIQFNATGRIGWTQTSTFASNVTDVFLKQENGGLRAISNNTAAAQILGGNIFWAIGGIVGTLVTVVTNTPGDVTLGLSGTFVVSDGAGNVAGGVITLTAPGANFNLYDDGGTNTCQLQVNANGSVGVIRTAGSRTYAVSLNLVWL